MVKVFLMLLGLGVLLMDLHEKILQCRIPEYRVTVQF